jgi:exonuclease SbcC
LSAIELALTGAIPSLGRAEPDYLSQLVHKQAKQGQVMLKVEGLAGLPTDVTLPVTVAGIRGRPLLPERLAKFYSERCYLPQSVLGRLLEFYQVSDARRTDSPLTEFVKDLLGLDQLDALIDGLHDAGDIRRLRQPVPEYAEVRENIQALERSIRADEAEVAELNSQISAAEVTLQSTLSVLNPTLARQPLDFALLRNELNNSAEEVRLSDLARARRNIEAARSEWQSIATPTDVNQRQQAENAAAEAQQNAEAWRNNDGRELETVVSQLADLFPELPSSISTDPEFARATALRSVEKELNRCASLLAQDEADKRRLGELDQELSRVQARGSILDQQISDLAADAGTLAQALAEIVPHIHAEDCPVCGRDFAEVSRRPLTAHVSTRIATLTENAGRLEALSKERTSTTTAIAQLGRERGLVEGRKISDVTSNEIKARRARLEDVRGKLTYLAAKTRQGQALLKGASQAARDLDALRSRDLRVTNFRATLANIGASLAIENVDINAPIDELLNNFQSSAADEERDLAERQRRRQRANSELAVVLALRAKLQESQLSIADQRSSLERLSAAKELVDERIATARELGRRAREVRTSVVRQVFNDTLNLVWHDLFIRLAPEEPFVPAFALPTSTDGPVEAILETLYREGGKGGNPRAILSAGNLNTAALTLFLSLHLSAREELPWLVIDDPVQSMDEVHIAQFAALLRTLSKSHGRQVILAVHEHSLFEYLALELSPAFSDDRLITIELGQAADGKTICNYEPLTWSPDPAFAAA